MGNHRHRSKQSSSSTPSRNRKARMFPNTDLDAFNYAWQKGRNKGPAERSRIYRERKAENERKKAIRNIFDLLLPPPPASYIPPRNPSRTTETKPNLVNRQTTKYQFTPKYIPKNTILDDIRNYRNSKIISSASNALAEFLVKSSSKTLNNSKKNVLRAVVAFVIAETLSEVFETEIKVTERIKTYIKIGKFIYEVTLWYNEQTRVLQTDNSFIKKNSFPHQSI